jgi:hypothetical protein
MKFDDFPSFGDRNQENVFHAVYLLYRGHRLQADVTSPLILRAILSFTTRRGHEYFLTFRRPISTIVDVPNR